MTQRGRLWAESGLARHHLWPRRHARLQIQSANVIFPSDFRPNGWTESDLVLSCSGQLGLNGGRVFNRLAEPLMRRLQRAVQRLSRRSTLAQRRAGAHQPWSLTCTLTNHRQVRRTRGLRTMSVKNAGGAKNKTSMLVGTSSACNDEPS